MIYINQVLGSTWASSEDMGWNVLPNFILVFWYIKSGIARDRTKKSAMKMYCTKIGLASTDVTG